MQYITIGNLGRPWSLRYKLKKNTLRFISEDDLKKSAMKKVFSLMNPSSLKVGDKKEYRLSLLTVGYGSGLPI